MHLIDTRAHAHTHTSIQALHSYYVTDLRSSDLCAFSCCSSAVVFSHVRFCCSSAYFSFVGCCKKQIETEEDHVCIGPIHDFCETETKAVDARICVCEVREPCATKIK
jgi:hypothetical protein